MGWKLHPAVEAELKITLVPMSKGRAQMQGADTNTLAILPPDLCAAPRVGKLLWPIDGKQRRAVNTDIARVAQERFDALDELEVVVGKVTLGDQHLVFRRTPPGVCFV